MLLAHMRKIFHFVGYAEGASLLLLMGIAMPLKYVYGYPEATKIIGAIHGLLFLLYGWSALQLSNAEDWDRKLLPLAVFFSCLPFGTFAFERFFLPKPQLLSVPSS